MSSTIQIRVDDGMMKPTGKDMPQKYILMHYSGLISPEQRIILSMQL